jgi:uncharacterized protein (DUF1697 family)
VSTNSYIALLRGINVGGHNRVPMAELRSLCGELGWQHVRTYIQSGNVLFQADAPAARLGATLEDALQRRFDLAIPVIVRAARDWPGYVDANPYPEASREQPNLVMLGLSRNPPAAGAVEALRERAADGERVTLVGDGLWIHFPDGAARSRLSPAVLDRLIGSAVTTRNWRTVLKLQELARSRVP